MYNNLHRKRTLLIKIQRNEWLSLTQFAKKEELNTFIHRFLYSLLKKISQLYKEIYEPRRHD